MNLNPSQFLKSILPPLRQGEVYVGAYSSAKSGGGMHQEHFESVEKLTEWSIEQSDSGRNAYMALASYIPHQNKKGNGPGRQGEYAQQVKAYWLDIDCSEEKAAAGDGYATIKEGVKALVGFSEENGLPKPTIVISGGGLHCYWALTDPIDASIWIETANKLHALTKKHGLLADPSRTHDVASVLRPVGTKNFKYDPPILVELRRTSEPIGFDAFKTLVESALASPKHETNANTALAPFQIDYPLADATKIVEQCPNIRAAVKDQAQVSEPWWHGIVGIAKFCDGPDKVAHQWSCKHPDYDNDETQAKLDNWKGTGATLCTTLTDHNPQACATCKHRGKINSPIVLGYPDNSNTQRVQESQTTDPVLSDIQENLALLKLKTIGVVERKALETKTLEGMAAPLVMFSREDGTLLLNRMAQSKFPDRQHTGLPKKFFHDPNTVCYQGVEFNPRETTGGYLNLWIGPTIVPKKGAWKTIREFLLEVICGGDIAACKYLVRYLAHALQKPWEKPGTMIAMIGGEGIGKGRLARILRRIWSATFLHVHTIKPIVGDYNESLERVFWVFLDEAIFAGDLAGTNALKALITEPTIHVNPKHQSPRTIYSYHRFIAATNAEHFKHVDPDNRRDFVLKVSEHKKGDKDYWDKLSAAIDGDEVDAMVYDLLQIDLTAFDVRTKPNTKELTLQKLQSLPPFQRWWFDGLYRGYFGEYVCDWPEFVSTQSLRDDFKTATQGIRIYKQMGDRDIKDKVRKMCPSAKDDQCMVNNYRRRGFKLPTLEIARAEFEKFIGDTVEWE